MGLVKPPVRESKNFVDEVGYDTPFILDGIRVVNAKSREYGEGKMVCMDVRGHSAELTIWGVYLTAQAEAAEPGDFGSYYKVVENKSVPDFTKRPVKALVPCEPGGDEIPF